MHDIETNRVFKERGAMSTAETSSMIPQEIIGQ